MQSRDYRIFWIGQFVSLIGTWMQNTVQPYLAYQLTGQPFYLGLIGFASTVPTLFLTLPAGVLVERMNKRHVVIAMQAIMALQAFVLAGLALTGQLTIWHIFVLALVLGAANAVEITARQVMVPDMVDKTQLPNALALNATGFNLARVSGPILAAPFLLLVANGGEGWAFFANGVSYLVIIASLFMIKARPRASEPAPAVSGVRAFLDGQDYIRQSDVVSLLIVTSAVIGFFGFTASQQIPVFARDVLAVAGEAESSVASRNSAMVAALGVGALIASVMLTWFSSFKRKGLLMTIGQIVFGLALIASSFSRSFSLSVVCLALTGWGQVTALNLTNQIIQLTVPSSLRSRVFSTYLWALQGVTPFGSLLMGWIAQRFSAPLAVLVGGSVCLLIPLGVNFYSAKLRQFEVSDSV